jgi:hypothetical protein
MSAKKLVFAVAMFAAIAANAQPTGQPADYGQAVSEQAAERTVEITANTRSVNVTNGQTVNFKVGDGSFAWHVSTYPNVNAFDLAKIAPAGVEVPNVLVYVTADDRYLN